MILILLVVIQNWDHIFVGNLAEQTDPYTFYLKQRLLSFGHLPKYGNFSPSGPVPGLVDTYSSDIYPEQGS
jgi:hypothetical protein